MMTPAARWQLLSLAVLACTIAAGFYWYERSRPTARQAALIATLVAFAVAGRVAFAAVPNVKPTTDIVLIGGYVLGAAPGFVIGSLSALISNIFFGQGPWTPWQMVGWGATGVVGALIGKATRKRLGRLPLAAICALAGLAFGVWMNAGSALNYAGGNATGGFIALQTQALPFDIAHALGNFAFFMIGGLALIRVLKSTSQRSKVEWLDDPSAMPGIQPDGGGRSSALQPDFQT